MINLKDVTKTFHGAAAIDRISMQIDDNGIYCLLGRNGAGKTTLMKLIAGHINRTDGSVTVNGKEVSVRNMPEDINYVEAGAAQFNMKVSELIEAAAAIQDGFDLDTAKRMAARYQLDGSKRYKHLSFGMKSMLSTILSLANTSRIVMLDEPTLGFDAFMRNQFNTLLAESYELHPRIIIVSTHLIDEIAKVAGSLIIINDGRLLLHTDISDIDERAYTLTGPADTLLPLLDNLNCIGQTRAGGRIAAHIYDRRIEPPQGVTIDNLSPQDFFVQMVGGGEHNE
ncbi:MAG: ABC transporter ATP-binding protein [Oscillospiraceae bacterium]|jgi:ABC-2 type transport system ATP-binding protein|nr:ABC transporter ATP-binding protein [Oscillospiraceae bacterium]